ncbi:hypothetical protein [Variovorax sp. KK3]|uniref:hypothetical protein n=1 Tax=Variovorax sp. KK3 TaxID=1855728 RepID=UPI00097C23C8|nr:hypothetical protein [Variovorax sp. KK3]
MTTTTTAYTTTTAPANALADVAFGSLIDLAMLRTGAVSAEVCEACSTINLGSARHCKGCHHKLPAFYASDVDDLPVMRQGAAPSMPRWARAWDLAAYWIVINSLVGVTVLVPLAS